MFELRHIFEAFISYLYTYLKLFRREILNRLEIFVANSNRRYGPYSILFLAVIFHAD